MSDLDLIQTIVEAASAAIRRRETAIKDGARQLRSVHLEMEIANGGQVIDTIVYLEWCQTHRRKGA